MDITEGVKINRMAEQVAHKPIVFAVSGIKNSGKTTLIEKLVKSLTSYGYQVGVIKHDGHEFIADHEGTDSFRHKKAGAKNVIVYSKTKFMMIEEKENSTLQELLALQKHMDIIILEGMKYSVFPKIEIVRAAVSSKSVCNPETLLALVTDTSLSLPNIKRIELDDFGGILECVMAYIDAETNKV